MKSLTEFLKESLDSELNLVDSIEYDKYQDLYLYLNDSNSLLERLQSICDTYRKKYNEKVSVDTVINSKIFNQFIDDIIKSYCKDVKNISLNVGTKEHLKYDIASKMVTKIRLEQDIPEPEEL